VLGDVVGGQGAFAGSQQRRAGPAVAAGRNEVAAASVTREVQWPGGIAPWGCARRRGSKCSGTKSPVDGSGDASAGTLHGMARASVNDH